MVLYNPWLLPSFGFQQLRLCFQAALSVNIYAAHCFKHRKVKDESVSRALGCQRWIILWKITNSTMSVKKFYIAQACTAQFGAGWRVKPYSWGAGSTRHRGASNRGAAAGSTLPVLAVLISTSLLHLPVCSWLRPLYASLPCTVNRWGQLQI